jgi:hypothetical protein
LSTSSGKKRGVSAGFSKGSMSGSGLSIFSTARSISCAGAALEKNAVMKKNTPATLRILHITGSSS